MLRYSITLGRAAGTTKTTTQIEILVCRPLGFQGNLFALKPQLLQYQTALSIMYRSMIVSNPGHSVRSPNWAAPFEIRTHDLLTNRISLLYFATSSCSLVGTAPRSFRAGDQQRRKW